jgi:hypothetical protein
MSAENQRRSDSLVERHGAPRRPALQKMRNSKQRDLVLSSELVIGILCAPFMRHAILVTDLP